MTRDCFSLAGDEPISYTAPHCAFLSVTDASKSYIPCDAFGRTVNKTNSVWMIAWVRFFCRCPRGLSFDNEEVPRKELGAQIICFSSDLPEL
jgi:hypothetical protein